MKLGKLLCVLAVIVLIGSVSFAGAETQDDQVIDLDEVPKSKQVNPKIESVLVQLHDVFTKDRGNMASFSRKHGMTIHSEIVWEGQGYTVWYDSVRVIFDFEDYSDEDIEDIESLGVKVETSDGNLVQALVPVFQLQSVSKLPFVKHVRLPLKPTVSVESQGVSVIRADELHDLGIYGDGVKVAILDGGFEGYEAKLGVELPSSVTTRSYYGDITGVAGDITGDGEQEVVIGSNDNSVYAFNGADGSVLWSYPTRSDITSSPAIAIPDAIDAASPSTCVTMRLLSFLIALNIAVPSNTSPPGELIRTKTSSVFTASRSLTNSSAVIPQNPISS